MKSQAHAPIWHDGPCLPSNDPRKADQHVNVTVTPNQVAHQLILNDKVPNRQRHIKIKRCGQENHNFDDDFTIVELQNSLKHLKNGLIPEQAGFRPGKSCTAQVLNLTQHIEDGFETGKITGIVLVDVSAAYDTVNHRRLLEKVYTMRRDYRLMCMIRTLLENRRFFVELGGKRSRWRSQRNGLPQGSVLAPLLFNV